MTFESTAQFNAHLLRAIQQERLVREAAFLPINGKIGRHEVMPVTLYRYLCLKVAVSPFLTPYGEATPDDLCQFLWVLNPEFSPANHAGKKKFLKRCEYFKEPKMPFFPTLSRIVKWKQRADIAAEQFQDLIRQAREFMDEELQDRPPASGSKIIQSDYYSDVASIIGELAREYGWSYESILHLKLRIIFQLRNEIKDYWAATRGKRAVLYGPSDRVKAEFLKQLNEGIKRN